MKGYVTRKGDRWYAVIYEGIDPVTGGERRSWHAAGTERSDAERLAARLAAERNGRNDEARSLSFGAYLTRRWLPGKQVVLAASTYAGYRRNVERHIVPGLGRIALRRLRPNHLDAFYATLLRGDGSTGLAPKTVYEIHLVIRGALSDAVRRGLVTRNVALVAHAPRTARHRQGRAALVDTPGAPGVPAGRGRTSVVRGAMDRGFHRHAPQRVLGLRWDDLDADKATL